MAPGTGTTQLVASTLRRATASRQRACRAKPRSIDSIEFPSGRGPARLNMCPRASRWTRRPSRSSSVSRSSAYSVVPVTSAAPIRPAASISAGKCPALARITPSRSSGRSAAVSTSLAPVTVTMMSASATARGRLLGPAQQMRVRAVQVPGVHLAVLGRRPDDGDALGPQPVHRVRLGGVEVAGRDQPGPSVAQREQQGYRLGLQVDAGADGQAVERAGPPALVRDAPQQPAVLADPVDARGNHLVSLPSEPYAARHTVVRPSAWTCQRTPGHDRFRAGIYFRTQAPVLPVRPSAMARRCPGQLEALYLRGRPGGGRTRPRHGPRLGHLPRLP